MRLIAKLSLPNLRRALKTTLRVFPKSSGYIVTVLERFEQVEFLYVYRYLRNRGTEELMNRGTEELMNGRIEELIFWSSAKIFNLHQRTISRPKGVITSPKVL